MNKKIALLIDTENVSSKYIDTVIDELTKFGETTIRRAYGDWSKYSGTNKKKEETNWISASLDHSIILVQQCSFTTGKNSSDSALIIDAMDILHSDKVNSFCILSSDSDFTRLAQRIREDGKEVVGMGEEKTPEPFRKSCNRFITLEVLLELDSKEDTKKRNKNEILPLIYKILSEESNDDGWMLLSDLGNSLSRKMADFDYRLYGYKKLSELIKNFKQLETKMTVGSDKKTISVMHVRKKIEDIKTEKPNKTKKKVTKNTKEKKTK